MHHADNDDHMQACIDACRRCHAICLNMAMTHCLEMGGRHSAPDHLRLMIACAEMCSASAAIMLTDSDVHRHSCRACADICEACAKSCEEVGEMEECVEACRACAEECRQMAA